MRVHVELAIERIKNLKISSGPVSHKLWPLLHQIFVTVAVL